MSSRSLALLVGSSRYRFDKEEFPDLPAAANDVDAFDQALMSPTKGLFHTVTKLKDPPPQKLLRAADRFFSSAEKEDLVLFYFSGHGKVDAYGRLYLATKDSRQSMLTSTSLPIQTLREILVSCKAQRVVVILDCCRSGKASSALAKGGFTLAEEIVSEGLGRYVLTSSGAMELSWVTPQTIEAEGQLSIFTQFLVEGIESEDADANSDGYIDLEELFEYASRRTKELKPTQKPTISKFGAEAGRIFLSRSSRTSPKAKQPFMPAQQGSYTGAAISGESGDVGNSYYFENIHLFTAWQLAPQQSNVRVALISGWCDTHHPALKHAEIEQIDRREEQSSPAPDFDDISTGLAGLIVGRDEKYGYAGIAPSVDLTCYRVLSSAGITTPFQVIMAIQDAVERGADILCLPLRFDPDTLELVDAIDTAIRLGALAVCSAGNDADSVARGLGTATSALTVAAFDRSDRLAPFSSFGSWVKIGAPGVDVWAPTLNDQYRRVSGTAAACAVVTGVVALMLSVSSSLMPGETTKLLVRSADDVHSANSGSHEDRTIPPRVNVYNAVLGAYKYYAIEGNESPRTDG